MKLDVERLLNWLMVVLLTLRTDCSLVALFITSFVIEKAKRYVSIFMR